MNRNFNAVDWESELAGDIDAAWSSFNQILFSIVNQHIPKIKIGGKDQPPWFDAEAHQLCRKKERLHSEYKGTEDPELRTKRYLKFSACRRKFKDIVGDKMGSSFEDNDDPNLITKKFWSYVKATSKNTRIPEMIHNEGVFKTKPTEQAQLFNSFFYQQFSERSNYDIPVEADPTDNQFTIDFDCNRVFSVLSKLNANKAMGPDKIHGKVLKICARSLSIPLSILFKKSYYSGSLPSDWKMAHIVPVHKKGSKSEVQNYRPISLTSLVVKVLERMVRDELMSRCDHRLDPRQHGFLPNKSCTTQLVEFCDSLSLSLNKNIRSDVIYFDFAKAFDSVNHDIILLKLKTIYNINGRLLAFSSNYLSVRVQKVVINGSVSDGLPVLSGVPQGSILGPSLFVLFINDMIFGLNEGTNIMLYADDTKIWREMVVEDDYNILQKDIDYLVDWAIQNKMRFHPSKCKVLSVSLSRPPLIDVLPYIQYFYSLGDNLLDYVSSEKDLGILMNSTLNFNDQANMLYSKANQKFGMLKRTCHFVNDANRRRALYLTLVRSLFEHCPMVWRPASNATVEKLESLQKRAIKWIRNDKSISYSTDDLYYIHCKQLNILPIKFRFDFHDLKFFHSIYC
ncbi:MAG: reverse transcriptase family protein [Cytophagales bacterium]|nr:reverse transcriptase family protein [Cytophagales bacterium]